ncbi:MAG: hypothetical protein AAGJ35_05735, partial [Myxococcota bacterium]
WKGPQEMRSRHSTLPPQTSTSPHHRHASRHSVVHSLLLLSMFFLHPPAQGHAAPPTLPGGPIFPDRKASPKNVLVVNPKKLKSGWKGLSNTQQKYIDRKELRRIQRQIETNPPSIPPRLGGVFVPRIIKRQNVARTSYLVYDLKGQQVASSRTGTPTYVYPGEYLVQVGTRTGSTLPRFRIRVYAANLTIVRSRWAALVVQIQDEALVQFRGTYDLIHLKSRRSVGTGIGADETIGEKVRPWLLEPGLYMIVKAGGTYLDRTNYFTVQVNEGEVTFFRAVVDRNSRNFLGGGVVLLQQLGYHRPGAWRWSIQLSGNFLWNNQENVPATKSGNGFTLSTFFSGRLTYNDNKHFFRTFLNLEQGFTLPTFSNLDEIDLRKSIDRVQLELIYIYRIWRLLGPYVRAGVDTSMFPGFYYLSDQERAIGASAYLCESQNNCTLQSSTENQLTEVNLSDFFDPLLFKQGFGINIQALQYSWLDLRILVGFGFRQELARSVYQNGNEQLERRCRNPQQRPANTPWNTSACSNSNDQEPHYHLRFFRKNSSNREGIELTLVANGRITRYLNFTTEFDILTQFSDFTDVDIDWRTTITLRLSHYASIFYRLRVRRDPAIPNVGRLGKWYIEQSAVISFSILL